MKMCDNDHSPVVFESEVCPVCSLLDIEQRLRMELHAVKRANEAAIVDVEPVTSVTESLFGEGA
jgi:hypothetical protein